MKECDAASRHTMFYSSSSVTLNEVNCAICRVNRHISLHLRTQTPKNNIVPIDKLEPSDHICILDTSSNCAHKRNKEPIFVKRKDILLLCILGYSKNKPFDLKFQNGTLFTLLIHFIHWSNKVAHTWYNIYFIVYIYFVKSVQIRKCRKLGTSAQLSRQWQ